MDSLLGPAAAFSTSITWAYASARYARASREVGSVRVNLARVRTVFPLWLVAGVAPAFVRGTPVFEGVTAIGLVWLAASVLSSYAAADSVFFTAARRVGYTTALAIASIFPLWAALWGTFVENEPFGPARVLGTALCVGGVIELVRLAGAELGVDGAAVNRRDGMGLLLSFLTSLLWAANSITVKRGAEGLPVGVVNMIRCAFALAFLAPQARWGEGKGRPAAPEGGWRAYLPAIVADSVIGGLCYVYGLAHTDLAVGATLVSLAPLVSVPVALALGVERWNGRRAAAVAATVAGIIALVLSGPARP